MPPDMQKLKDAVGSRLRSLRKKRGLSQPKLAEAAGVSVDTIYRIEKGRDQDPRLPTYARLAEALGVPVGDLFPHTTSEALSEMEQHFLSLLREMSRDTQENLLQAVSGMLCHPKSTGS